MSPYTAAFLNVLDENLLSLSDRRVKSIAEWVAAGNYRVEQSVLPFFACCTPVDQTGLSSAFAEEINKMSMGAFETIVAISKTSALPRSTAWLLIKFYYAAFYSAHSLLRLSGRSYTRLSEENLNHISSQVPARYGSRILMEAGHYRFSQLDSGKSQILTISKVSDISGGSHGALWGEFFSLLDILYDSASRSQTLTSGDRDKVIGLLTKMRLAFKKGGLKKAVWLTNFRNIVNYRFGDDLWFPYRRKQSQVDEFYELVKNAINHDFDKLEVGLISSDSTKLALSLCGLVIALNSSIIELIGDRGPRKSFVKQGPLRLRSLADF